MCWGMFNRLFSHEANVSLKKSQTFIKKAGGAPANVCAAISKLGGEAIFLGKVGADPFGDFLEETLQSVGVHTNLLVKDSSSPTTLAFVSLGEDGQRDFVFNRGADANLTLDDVPLEIVGAMKIIHFGSATALLTPLLIKHIKKYLLMQKIIAALFPLIQIFELIYGKGGRRNL